MRNEFDVLRAALEIAERYLASVDEAHVGPSAPRDAAHRPLPSVGVGAPRAIEQLTDALQSRSHASTGPRYFHYVVGGVTPAALAADWLTSAFDQVASSSTGSPVGVELEETATRWLLELFDFDPDAFTGHFTTGATMANLVGLAAARQWWGERQGVDLARAGFHGLPAGEPPMLFSSGFVHTSAVKALSILGFGRQSVRKFQADNRGTLDLPALRAALEARRGEPSILLATAGEVNAGGFDPIAELADLAEEFDAWLHVDGAFGLFARASSNASALGAGIERAHSIASDAHKWLNVPYDCGFVFVRERALMAKSFRMVADYLPPAFDADERTRVPGNLGPECSRRARALPVFATLVASGRDGVRAMVDRHLELAQSLAARVRSTPDLELVDDVVLNVVPFRLAPAGMRRRDLDALNEEVGRRILADGQVFVGTTRYRSVICFRPAIANWRMREADIALLINVVLEIGAQVLAQRDSGAE